MQREECEEEEMIVYLHIFNLFIVKVKKLKDFKLKCFDNKKVQSDFL